VSTSEEKTAAREKFKADFVSVIYETSDEIGALIERGHGKIWAARLDVAKTTLSLASAFLVLTLTFSERLLPEGAVGATRWLISSAWLTLLLCCASSLLSMWVSIKLRAAPAMIRNEAEAAHDHVLAAAKSAATSDDFDLNAALLGSPFREVFKALESTDRRSSRLTGAALGLLLLSLALIAAAGVVQFAS
jgi:hypothetical protein